MKSAEPEASPLSCDVLEPSGDSAGSSDGPGGLREREELGDTGDGGVNAECEVDGIAVSVDATVVVGWEAVRL